MSLYTRSKTEPELFAKLLFGSFIGLNVRVGVGSRTYVVQKPRTNAPNAFSMTRVRCPVPPVGTVTADQSVALLSTNPGGRLDYYKTLAYNKAYAKLIGQVTEARSNLALNVVDYKKSFATIASRAGQLLRIARALNRYDYAGAWKAAGLNPERGVQHVKEQKGYRGKGKRRTVSRSDRAKNAAGDTANAWLELQFGILPVIKDIGDAIKVLGNTPPAITCVGHGRVKIETGEFFHDSNFPKMKIEGFVGVKHQLRVQCSSPNLLLLHELGLDNPAHVLWDAVPFSFVFDWLFPVGKFLQSWTDFVGLTVHDSFTTVHWNVTDTGKQAAPSLYSRSSRAIRVDRTLGTPSFKFPTVAQYKHGLWKQATETALILQKLMPVLDKLDRKIKLGR